MADQATQRTTIMATPQRCFDAATDFERYPAWAPEVRKATVLTTDDDGRGIDVEYEVSAMGRCTTYTLCYSYDDSRLRLRWHLKQGDATSRLDGSYEFLPVESEPEMTEVIYHLSVELAVPLPGFVKRRAETRIMHTALEQLKAFVESGATQLA